MQFFLKKMAEGIELSIVIPNFNSGILLDHTLKSIFSKETSLLFEVLIMDNLSRDNPLVYINKYPKDAINFFSSEDSGIYDAMNKGIGLASGTWLMFLGAGDKLLLDQINIAVQSENSEFDLVYGNVIVSKSNKLYDGSFNLMKLLYKNISHQAIIYKSSVFNKIGMYDLHYKIWADYLMNLEIFFNKKMNKKYLELVFCTFQGEGISDQKKDFRFSNRKKYIYLKLLMKYLSWSNFCVVCVYFFNLFITKLKSAK
ncbi:glycosyltransferase [uncultured Algoriphagus sp.]|uniref:glycosyltransferase n=1 Tax=uncultured Algoriphagus sp. TaxID=417365 RepID=UPI0030EE80F5|tara:strand:- start:18622 stop:19389 length:768 start_codon:yes stop_codon:yes gene_type:complete